MDGVKTCLQVLKSIAVAAAFLTVAPLANADVEQAPPLNSQEQAHYDKMRDNSNEYFLKNLKGPQSVDGDNKLNPKFQYHLEVYGRKTTPGSTKIFVSDPKILAHVREEVDRAWYGRTEHVAEPVDMEDKLIEGPAGDIELRVYKPKEAANGPLPILVYFHGGGWIFASIKAVDRSMRYIATEANVIVVSANYRLLPNQYPAAQDDTLAAFRWARDNAEALGGVSTNVAVGGDSAGGQMSASIALKTRDLGEQGPSLQLLYYPALDTVADEKTYPSLKLFAEGYGLTADFSEFVLDVYFADKEARKSPYASPNRADSLAGLPPAIIATANFDIIRDHGKTYAAKLKAAGVPVTYMNFDGMIHGFMQQTYAVQEARDAVREVTQAFAKQIHALQ